MKSKYITGLLSLLFGCLGFHKFYLGEGKKGLLLLSYIIVILLAWNHEYILFLIFYAAYQLCSAIYYFIWIKRSDFDQEYNNGENSSESDLMYKEKIKSVFKKKTDEDQSVDSDE